MRSNRTEMCRLVRTARVPVSLASLLVASACVDPAVRPASSLDYSVAPQPLRGNTVDLEALSSAGSASLYETLVKLRPEWFRVNPTMRHATEPARAVAYIDDVYSGELTTLAFVPAVAVIEVRYLPPSQARDVFGSACRCAGGVVRVFTRQSAASRLRFAL
jgi:hypothetical protein